MSRSSSSLQPRSLQNLRAYQLAKNLGHLVYDATADFPRNEFRLIGQMRGAAISVFGNIAEGYGRNMLGALLRSLRERKTDGSWDRTYKSIKEETTLYNITLEDQSPNLPVSHPSNPIQDNHDV